DRNHLRPFAEYFAQQGIVCFLADYRTYNKHKTSPFESLMDAKSAMRFIRSNAKKFQINPNKIIAAGGSAGGHLAASCFTNTILNESTDNLEISPLPNALVLFNPVLDNGPSGFGYEKIKEKYPEFSPFHSLKSKLPPTILFLGTMDKLIPVKTLEDFRDKAKTFGAQCELYIYENQPHGFFNHSPFREDVIVKTEEFLKKIDYLK
ncbi:MAG: alpha/beta hydrolase, partial [Leadbetterella sp.]